MEFLGSNHSTCLRVFISISVLLEIILDTRRHGLLAITLSEWSDFTGTYLTFGKSSFFDRIVTLAIFNGSFNYKISAIMRSK